MAQKDFWNRLKQRVREVSTAAADFTEEQAIIGKLKFDILTLKRKLDRQYRDLGQYIVEMASSDPRPNPYDDAQVKEAMETIEDLEQQIEENKEAITSVTDEFRAKSAAARQRAADREMDDLVGRDDNKAKKDTGDGESGQKKTAPKKKTAPQKPSSGRKSSSASGKKSSTGSAPAKKANKKQDEAS